MLEASAWPPRQWKAEKYYCPIQEESHPENLLHLHHLMMSVPHEKTFCHFSRSSTSQQENPIYLKTLIAALHCSVFSMYESTMYTASHR
jgi:hypothetical protein